MDTDEAGLRLERILEPQAPHRPRTRRAPVPLTLAAIVVACGTLLPAAYLIVRASGANAVQLRETLWSARSLQLLGATSLLTITVTAASVAIAVPLAWLTVRTDLPGRRAWAVAFSLPLVIPSYVGGYVFVAALGPRGLVQGWLEPLGVQRLPSIYGFPGAWLVLTLFTYPYVFLSVRAALRRLDPSLEEAAMSLSRTQGFVFRHVILPQLRPSVIAGALLVALYVLHDFGAVSLMRFDTFTRAIYLEYAGSFDRTRAALLSMMLVGAVLIVLAAEARSRGRAAYYRSHAGAMRPVARMPLGPWRWPAVAACSVLVVLALGVPLAVIGYWTARGVASGEPLRFALDAAGNTLRASGIAAAAALVAAWPVSIVAVRYPSRLARLAERATFVGYALPGLVVALALVFFGARYVPAAYQTLGLLVFAYVVLFLPQAIGSLRGSMLQINPALEDAARSLGSGWVRTTTRVILPLVRPGVVAAVALVFLTAAKELPATLLLAPTGYATLATEVWGSTNAAAFGRAAIPALMLVALASVPLAVLLGRFEERER